MSTTKQPPAPLPFWKHVVAGGAAGLCEILVMYPLDVVKTRLQLQTSSTTGEVYSSVGDCLKKIVKAEGPSGLYRGIMSPILGEVPKRAIKFGSNEAYKKMLYDCGGGIREYRFLIAGSLAGATEAFVNTPFEVVKVKMQAVENLGRYKSTSHCFVSVLQTEGIASGLYRGLLPQLLRNVAWNGTYFGVMPMIAPYFPDPGDSKGRAMLNKFIGGTFAGGLATCMNTPLDVVKSRYQNAEKGSAQEAKYSNPVRALGVIAREEGVASLWKGLAPRLMRLGPGGGIMIVAFDVVAGWLSKF